MALAATLIVEVRNGGSDSNAGWFDPAPGTGTDYTLQDTAQATITANLSASGTTTLTDAGGSNLFTSAMVNNTIRISGGTLTAGLYIIKTYTDANNVVLDRTPGTGSGSTGVIGGALATPGQAAADIEGSDGVAGMGGFVKYHATPFDCSATPNVAGGRISLTRGGSPTAKRHTWLKGYDTNRTFVNRDANQPTLRCGASSVTLITLATGSGFNISNLRFDGNNQTSSRGINTSANVVFIEDCTFTTFKSSAINSTAERATIFNCSATACNTSVAFQGPGRWLWCEAYANSGVNGFGVNTSIGTIYDHCISDGNAIGFETTNTLAAVVNLSHCTAYGNSSDGFKFGPNGAYFVQTLAVNCIAYGNGGYGFNAFTSALEVVRLESCAYGSNTSGNVNTTNILSAYNTNGITLTADPFTNAAGRNFGLNSTSGGGALLRNLGFGGYKSGAFTHYPDVGAVQHQDSGGSTFAMVLEG